MKNKKTDNRAALTLAVILIFICIAALTLGSAEMNLQSLLGGILKKDGFATESTILYSLRLPRILAGALAGIGLSCSGVLLQAVTGNSLASPNIIGVNAGAGFIVVVMLAFFPSAISLLPLGAFSGAFITTLFILYICSKINFSKSTVILAGVAVTALLNAAISFVSYFDSDVLSVYRYFSVGGLSGITPEQLKTPALIIFTSVAIMLILSSKIDTLCLGDSLALSLGVNVKGLRLICLITASAAAGSVVSFAGLLGFVGLVVPHIARKLSGGNAFFLTVNSCLIGSSLVVLSDLFGRTLLSPTEIPVGIIMSFIGAPFLFYLLARRKSHA